MENSEIIRELMLHTQDKLNALVAEHKDINEEDWDNIVFSWLVNSAGFYFSNDWPEEVHEDLAEELRVNTLKNIKNNKNIGNNLH